VKRINASIVQKRFKPFERFASFKTLIHEILFRPLTLAERAGQFTHGRKKEPHSQPLAMAR
jgi:hypothetical protein